MSKASLSSISIQCPIATRHARCSRKIKCHRAKYNFHIVSGNTFTGAAIDETARNGFNEEYGARPSEDGVPRVLVVLTDGKSSDSVKKPSENVS